MTIRWAVPLLLWSVCIGCTTARVVRLETGLGSIEVMPREEPGAEVGAAELDDDEFEEVLEELAQDVRPFRNPMRQAREVFGVPSRSGMYRYESRSPHLIPQRGGNVEGSLLLELYADESLTREYGRWCADRDQAGDCLRLLDEGPLLGSDGKYTLALAIAMDSVWEETSEAFEDMANPQALTASVTAAAAMYLMLWALPEPVSKGVAATMTALAIAYLGVDTVWRLLDGWLTLVREVGRATSFEQLHAAGEAYGEVLGENAARVFVMLATAAIGSTAGLVGRSGWLPGSAQAALAVESQAGFQFAGVAGVRSVAMTTEGFTIALAPNALAMANRGVGRGEKHHIATNKNDVSAARGGPWTPEFRRLFRRAGMELKDPENIVRVSGHKGPHPEEYHRFVFNRLQGALGNCRTVVDCRKVLTEELRLLSREAQTPGTLINRWVTKGQ
ncbi:AHH domain-containing protein [Myxococcus landrumensis]|uniref:AHH domain-containing protein n=1 Tax=Myxococcus landrumensis TaxID=2813577 RepID=A0ABX7N4G5_9BACT|nr:AHH domain-containing protein [Myxococcus landrumus]QSQ13284.1 AHH domain-containing protein [Myxococcus landrumus]